MRLAECILKTGFACINSASGGCGVRTHAHFCAEDLKSSPLTTRANHHLTYTISDKDPSISIVFIKIVHMSGKGV